jgi:hypothetical protein
MYTDHIYQKTVPAYLFFYPYYIMSNFSTKIASTASVVALVATAMSASLVSAASEFLPYAELLADNSVIGVQSNESGYRLGDTVTRAELAKITANIGGYTSTACAGTTYGDVGSKLGDLCGAIEALAEAGVVSTANANFRPNASVTRAEAVKMLLGSVGEAGSSTDAGYKDVANLGDLAMYINRANELGCAADATYFRPNATSSRGEAFKVAACVAGYTPSTPTTPTGTGVVVPPTGTGVVTVGTATVALDGTATAQYVPMNASNVKVGTVKVTAGKTDVTVNSLTINRSGLGDSAGLTVAVGMNGTVMSESRSVNSATQDAIVRLNNPTTIKAGTTVSFDVLVSVSGSANSQHQFTLKAVGTVAAVTGMPVTLGLLNTTSYTVSSVAINTIKMNSVTSGKNDQSLGTVELRAGSKDVTLGGFILSKVSGVDLTKALANVSVYKNSVKVGTATVTSDKIYVTGLAYKLPRNDTATFELRGDVTYVGANAASADDIKLNISETTDVSGIEDLTGYSVSVSGVNNTPGASQVIVLSSLDLIWTKNTTKSVTIAPGTSNVVLFDSKLSSSASFDVTNFSLSTVGSATPTVDATTTGAIAETAAYNSLTLTVNGVDYDLLSTNVTSAGLYTFSKTADKFRIDAGTPVNVRLTANLSNTAGTGVYSYKVSVIKVKNVSTGNEVTLASPKDITGDNVTVAAPSITIKAATVAAPSATKIYSNATGLEIGRFGLEAKSEEITVREVTLTNKADVAGVFTGVTDLSKLVSGTNVKLLNVADGTQVSATVTMSGKTAIKLTGMSIKVAKDTTSNFKVLVDTQGDLVTTASGNIALNVALMSASSSSNATITLSTYQTTKTYSVSVIPPTVTLVKKDANTFVMKITNVDADQDITLSSVTAQVRPVSVANSSYAAFACIRDEGSADKCGLVAQTGAVQAVPGVGVVFTISKDISGNTFPVTISKNSSVTREIYVDSSFVNPSDLQAEITSLNFGVSETYSVVAK